MRLNSTKHFVNDFWFEFEKHSHGLEQNAYFNIFCYFYDNIHKILLEMSLDLVEPYIAEYDSMMRSGQKFWKLRTLWSPWLKLLSTNNLMIFWNQVRNAVNWVESGDYFHIKFPKKIFSLLIFRNHYKKSELGSFQSRKHRIITSHGPLEFQFRLKQILTNFTQGLKVRPRQAAWIWAGIFLKTNILHFITEKLRIFWFSISE